MRLSQSREKPVSCVCCQKGRCSLSSAQRGITSVALGTYLPGAGQLSLMLTGGNGDQTALWSPSLPNFSDVCYLTGDHVFPVGTNGTNITSQGQAMSCRSRGLSRLGSDRILRTKLGLRQLELQRGRLGALGGVGQHAMKVVDKFRAIEFPWVFLCLIWKVSHGLGKDLSDCSAKPVFIHRSLFIF